MRNILIAAVLGIVALPSSQLLANDRQGSSERSRDGELSERRFEGHDNRRFEGHDNRRVKANQKIKQQRRAAWQDYKRYDYNRYDPKYGGYQAERYYRDGRYYQQRRLTNNDRVYRGSNSRYYCRRNDGTTGLIIGAIGGGLLGRSIAPSRSKTLGAILGGTGGALIGRSIGRNGLSCR
ncbi:glycine zipper 2TM domain-containing protein [Sphingorhabdus pulchriflava]|uniref:17 kDa surface antigen n=1 Tax=Sphingorhabdus pulchriflava TaxID=2292257 RepID=A0A371BF43_9SPHN|nr:glycine zipper 2TM domain-containing protein [Sphingorhabdus pulchriflava]RDV06128.1 glycine zipper 2TM domain-containing protein [Sphingorhabdus pulchriflava]